MLVPAYAATVYKSQGSEYSAVVIPVLTQHYAMLQRNLLYTGGWSFWLGRRRPAQGHFTVRKLERAYGKDIVRAEYERLAQSH
jgi:UvrD-like helicase C-terminal domain